MHAAFVKHVVFPLHERVKGLDTLAWLDQLERNQRLTSSALQELQFRDLRALVDFAYEYVPYYRTLLDEHELPPRRIQSPADFAGVPALTKDLIRRHFDALQPRMRRRRTQRISTGGSTGAPVSVLVDAERNAVTQACRLRVHRWFGLDIGVREVVLWGSPIELTRQDRVRRLRDWLVNSRLVSAFDLGEASLARAVRLLRHQRPLKLFGYASALYLLARYLQRTGFRPGGRWPRAVFATAEPLFEFQRVAIAEAFGCAVGTEYGAREAGLIAGECPEGGLHVHADAIVVELEPTADSRLGEVTVTNLHSYAMPLIRYRTGDIAAAEVAPCRCGRALPMLGRVEGRTTDFLVTPDGRVMHALAAIYVLREVPEVREFQILQDRLDRLRVSVVPEPQWTPAVTARIVLGLHRLLGDRVSIEVDLVVSIDRPPSGKHRYVISDVANAALEQLLG